MWELSITVALCGIVDQHVYHWHIEGSFSEGWRSCTCSVRIPFDLVVNLCRLLGEKVWTGFWLLNIIDSEWNICKTPNRAHSKFQPEIAVAYVNKPPSLELLKVLCDAKVDICKTPNRPHSKLSTQGSVAYVNKTSKFGTMKTVMQC